LESQLKRSREESATLGMQAIGLMLLLVAIWLLVGFPWTLLTLGFVMFAGPEFRAVFTPREEAASDDDW